ncbi:hypothetical protein NDU88_006956 [Pleurodeles waltl]|uniref:Uncharacterized protein n=1 Tax=Pleurodeles waltl TaxID=8319 RepID=A0AAV7QJ87_PLEWA|nr:hypothetical protein NDU88_006956 [Pleurodeles waltl]
MGGVKPEETRRALWSPAAEDTGPGDTRKTSGSTEKQGVEIQGSQEDTCPVPATFQEECDFHRVAVTNLDMETAERGAIDPAKYSGGAPEQKSTGSTEDICVTVMTRGEVEQLSDRTRPAVRETACAESNKKE